MGLQLTEPSPESGLPTLSDKIGARVRHARMVRGLTLKEVAFQARCAESTVSRIERGLMTLSLALLHRLACVLGTNVSALTAEEGLDKGPILRAGQRPTFAVGNSAIPNGIVLEAISTAARAGLLQANIHIVQPGASTDGQIEHIGEEVGYVLQGSLVLFLNGERHEVQAGDAFHFSSHIPHGYENQGVDLARILWVNTPATF